MKRPHEPEHQSFLRTKRHYTRGYILLFALTLLFFSLGSFIRMDFPLPASLTQLIRGQWTGRLEDEFDKGLPLSRQLIAAWNSARYLIYGEGLDGVQIGSDGWLFSSEEWYEHPRGADELLAAIPRVRDALAARGIDLLVLPVPAKNQIYGEYSKIPLSSGLMDAYPEFLALLKKWNVPAVDLQTRYRELAAGPDASLLYLKTDTHWTPLGARYAAEAVEQALRALGQADFGDAYEYKSRRAGSRTYRGDLFEFLPAASPEFAGISRQLPPPDSLESWITDEIQAPELSLFGSPAIPVALVGTSYSAGERWNFAGFLREALGSDVLNFAVEGRGPLAPAESALEGATLEENSVRLVIWEIPMRYLGIISD